MRRRDYFEAYLDDFHKVQVYMKLNYYNGESKSFYLEDEFHHQIPLVIEDKIIIDGYHLYKCSFEEDIVFGREYNLFCEHARSIPLHFGYVVKQPLFDELFYYEKKDLGACYHKSYSEFRIWAPTAYRVQLSLYRNGNHEMISMERKEKGVYEAIVKGNLLDAEYEYYIEVNGEVHKCIDPYGKASTPNSKRSVVVDIKTVRMKAYDLPKMNSYCDAIIYEMCVRDYTKKGTFQSLIEENRGRVLDYLKHLGITHVQLLPVMDFKSVDDLDVGHYYNWGYDAYQWMAFENSYSSNVHDASRVMCDMADLINELHKIGIRVNLDVVFNHVYDREKSALELSVPHYYFQYNADGWYSNASCCGNDVDSSRKMCRKLIVESCEYLASVYHIDGLRFDLMGILDIDTMNEVVSSCQKINPDFMVYGEGWNMPCYLEEEKRATMFNQSRMPKIAHFSDRFREIIKGATNHHALHDLGYLLADTGKIYQAMNTMGGSTQNIGGNALFMNADQCVNYVECHDNMTSWDKIDAGLQRSIRVKKCHHRLLLAAVLLAQGIPFIHGGQEFARTKHGHHNTYNLPDSVNKINWALAKRNADMIEYVKDLIALRKRYSCLRQHRGEDIACNVSYEVLYDVVLSYRVKDENDELLILWNPTYTTYGIEVDQGYEMIFYNNLLKEAEEPKYIDIHGITLVIFHKKKESR